MGNRNLIKSKMIFIKNTITTKKYENVQLKKKRKQYLYFNLYT